MDILVPISMKNAAKCDMQSELQNSTSLQIFERNWPRLIPGMFVSVCWEITHLSVVEGLFFYKIIFLPLNSEEVESDRPAEVVTSSLVISVDDGDSHTTSFQRIKNFLSICT